VSSVKSDTRKLLRELQDVGLTLHRRQRGWKVYDGRRLVTVVHTSPSDYGWRRNFEMYLRRGGVDLKHPTTGRRP